MHACGRDTAATRCSSLCAPLFAYIQPDISASPACGPRHTSDVIRQTDRRNLLYRTSSSWREATEVAASY
eukprot:scaffold661273_cov59-Prasinocladus_malaysianus.AAC.1